METVLTWLQGQLKSISVVQLLLDGFVALIATFFGVRYGLRQETQARDKEEQERFAFVLAKVVVEARENVERLGVLVNMSLDQAGRQGLHADNISTVIVDGAMHDPLGVRYIPGPLYRIMLMVREVVTDLKRLRLPAHLPQAAAEVSYPAFQAKAEGCRRVLTEVLVPAIEPILAEVRAPAQTIAHDERLKALEPKVMEILRDVLDGTKRQREER